jgi:hypothetical protein
MKTVPWTPLIIGLLMISKLTVPAFAANPPAIEWQNVRGGSMIS